MTKTKPIRSTRNSADNDRRVSNTHIPHLVVVKDAEEQVPVHGRRRRTTASESPQSSLSHHFPGTFTSLWHDLCAYLTRPRAHPCRLNVFILDSLTRIPDRFLQRRHFSLSGLLVGTFILRCCITAGVWNARARLGLLTVGQHKRFSAHLVFVGSQVQIKE